MYDAIIMLLGMLWLLLGIIGLLLDHNKNKSLIERRNLFYVFFLHFWNNTDTSIQYLVSPHYCYTANWFKW
jgi:hypothetical protein